MRPIIYWFRQDLRLSDNATLSLAKESGRPILPVFILDDETPGKWKWGGASRWWLHHSLEALGADLEKLGAKLVLRRGDAEKVLLELAKTSEAEAVVWTRAYEPYAVKQELRLEEKLTEAGLAVKIETGSLLVEPDQLKTKMGGPFKVFTPFWKAARERLRVAEPLSRPRKILGFEAKSETLASWKLLPTKPDWSGGMREMWTPGEKGAHARLQAFTKRIEGYPDGRDRPDLDATSFLSPHLHWGEISPRQVWTAVTASSNHQAARDKFLSEIGWREFSAQLLFHHPTLPAEPLHPQFEKFPWVDDRRGFTAWTKGQTGVPIVDAGMRQLWHTGWMHNRVRMVVASFLIKHLLVDWRRGESWFWDTLVDADLANNSASWQWVAGSGADAAPFFRVFNPVLQGEKFDQDGVYVREWIPEIGKLPNKLIHAPWKAKPEDLARAGVRLGKDYPHPIVDLDEGRERALAAYRSF